MELIHLIDVNHFHTKRTLANQYGGYCVVCGVYAGVTFGGPDLCPICEKYLPHLFQCECCELWSWWIDITPQCCCCQQPICKHCDESGEHTEKMNCHWGYDDDEMDDDEPSPPSHNWRDECFDYGGLYIQRCEGCPSGGDRCKAVRKCPGCINCAYITLPPDRISGWELKDHPFLTMGEEKSVSPKKKGGRGQLNSPAASPKPTSSN